MNRPYISNPDEWYNRLDTLDRWEYYNKVVLYSLKLEKENAELKRQLKVVGGYPKTSRT